MYGGFRIRRKPNPKENANFFSTVTFLFTVGLFKAGYKRDIKENDIYAVLSNFESSEVGHQLQKKWCKGKETRKKPSIYHLLWVCYGKYYLLLGLAQLTMKIIMVMLYPEAFKTLVSYFTIDSKLTKLDAVYYAFLVIFLNLISCTFGHNYMLLITELGIEIKTAFCSLIYRKALKLSNPALSKIGIGRIVTLISKDVTNFESFLIFLNDLWISVILLTVASFKMYSEMGVAALIGILFFLLIIPLQVGLGRLTSKLRIKAGKMTDQRLQATQESLSSIKIIKMCSWESIFIDKLLKARENEMEKIKQIYFTRATFLEVGSLVISLTQFLIVKTYTSLGNKYTARTASFLAGCFQILRSPVTLSIPLGIFFMSELIASVKRIHSVLTAEEQDRHCKISAEATIELERVSVQINEISVLNNVNFKIDKGFHIIKGKIGCGKSSLLKTILQDYPVSSGKLNVTGRISYASQEPWLFPSTIKQNILFGHSYIKQRYQKILEICALEKDLSSFVEGDETIINDRGMNLSKGQQARINLARAIYFQSDIYLLDDNLSSLDTHLQDFIFTNIKTFLKDKIVIMVSNNERHVNQADNIVIMKNGSIQSISAPSEMEEATILQFLHERDNEELAINETEKNYNLYHEDKQEGKVEFKAYKKYLEFGGGFAIFTLILAVYVLAEVASVYTNKMLANWINVQQKISDSSNILRNTTEYHQMMNENETVSGFYTVSIIASIFFFFLRAYSYFKFASRASLFLHNSMAKTIMNTTMKFFDLHYIGNILNRCAKDFNTIDESLHFNVYELLKFISLFVGTLILILHVNWYFFIPATVLIICSFLLRAIYIPTGRSLKRLDSATRSPMIGHLNATLEGLSTIKAHANQDILIRDFDTHQNLYTSTYYMLQSCIRAFAYFLSLLCHFFTSIIIILLIVGKNTLPGNVVLVITQSSQLNGLLQWGIRQWADLESHMTSVERVIEYTNAEKESRTGQISESWPRNGQIVFKNVNLTYGKSKDFILKNINFTIGPGEKIGIVGRTGVGKTSLVSLLFRLYNYEGIIRIDDIDIRTLLLDVLRNSIAIIPQDPILFSGTIRSNLDPFKRYKDEEIWEVIKVTNLKKIISSLYLPIFNGGSDFSSGQKQLICLARAMMRKSKIVVIDEATSNIDFETDTILRKIVKKHFSDCTVLTIAHRIETILDSDKVMVLEKGEIVEFDYPEKLMNKEDGNFYSMIHKLTNKKNC